MLPRLDNFFISWPSIPVLEIQLMNVCKCVQSGENKANSENQRHLLLFVIEIIFGSVWYLYTLSAVQHLQRSNQTRMKCNILCPLHQRHTVMMTNYRYIYNITEKMVYLYVKAPLTPSRGLRHIVVRCLKGVNGYD